MGGRGSNSMDRLKNGVRGTGKKSMTKHDTGVDVDALKARRKELREQARQLITPDSEIMPGQEDKYFAIREQQDEIEYSLFRALGNVSETKLQEKIDEKGITDLTAKEVNIVRNDMLADHDVYMAIASAEHGVYVGQDTAVDRMVNSSDKMYKQFSKTRAMLRKKYGETVTLYRSPTGAIPKATVNMTTKRSNAAQYGGGVKAYKIPVDDILAINVSRLGGYEEVIVLNRKRKRY